jgi:hypothetical protein
MRVLEARQRSACCSNGRPQVRPDNLRRPLRRLGKLNHLSPRVASVFGSTWRASDECFMTDRLCENAPHAFGSKRIIDGKRRGALRR